MIDIHHHLIHGVDDGAQTFEQTQAMICSCVENGIYGVITTPHAVPGQVFFDIPRYSEHFRMAQEWIREKKLKIALYPGAEIFYTSDTLRMLDAGRIPTLNNTRYVLLEFGLKVSFETLLSVAEELTEADYKPVFAHVERYSCLNSSGHIRKLREQYGVLMQMNANTVLHTGSIWRQLKIKRLLQKGLIDVVASDAHNLHSRPCRMAQAYQKLSELCGTEAAQNLFVENPEHILEAP